MFHCTITLRRGQDSEEIIIHHFHIAHNTSCLPLPTKKNWITTVCSRVSQSSHEELKKLLMQTFGV